MKRIPAPENIVLKIQLDELKKYITEEHSYAMSVIDRLGISIDCVEDEADDPVPIRRMIDGMEEAILRSKKILEISDIREFAYGMSVANFNPEDVEDYMTIAKACAKLESRYSHRLRKQNLTNHASLIQ